MYVSNEPEISRKPSIESPLPDVRAGEHDEPEGSGFLQSLSHPVDPSHNKMLSEHSGDQPAYDSGTVVRRLTDPPKSQKPLSRPSNRREMSSALRKGFHGVFGKGSEASKAKSRRDKDVLSE